MRKCKEKYEIKPFVLFCFIIKIKLRSFKSNEHIFEKGINHQHHDAIDMTIVVTSFSIVFNGIKMQIFHPVIDPSTLARPAAWYTSLV